MNINKRWWIWLVVEIILCVPQQANAVVILHPGVPTPLVDLFPIATTATVPYWSLGLYHYVDQPAPPYAITGGTTFEPGTSGYYGRETSGNAFSFGTDVYYAYQG